MLRPQRPRATNATRVGQGDATSYHYVVVVSVAIEPRVCIKERKNVVESNEVGFARFVVRPVASWSFEAVLGRDFELSETLPELTDSNFRTCDRISSWRSDGQLSVLDVQWVEAWTRSLAEILSNSEQSRKIVLIDTGGRRPVP